MLKFTAPKAPPCGLPGPTEACPAPWLAMRAKKSPRAFEHGGFFVWRRDPESNWARRICNPLHNRFAIAPKPRCDKNGKLELPISVKKHERYFNVWSGKRDSNSRPQPWQGCALPTELFPHLSVKLYNDKSNFEAKQTRWPENLKHTKTKKGKRWLPFLIERCWHFFRVFGAGNEIRTRDLNLGKVALYQLSYSRVFRTT